MTKLVITAVLLAACGGNAGSQAQCDGRVRGRKAWMQEPNPLRADKATPADLGMVALGDCSEKIKERQLSCGDSTIQASRDNPYLWEALDLGFTAYVCEFARDGQFTTVEHPLAVVMGPRRNTADKFDEVLREITRFRDRMCNCHDATCADEIVRGHNAYVTTMTGKLGKQAVLSAEQRQRSRAIDKEFADCQLRALTK